MGMMLRHRNKKKVKPKKKEEEKPHTEEGKEVKKRGPYSKTKA